MAECSMARDFFVNQGDFPCHTLCMARKINAEWRKKIRRLDVLTFIKQGLVGGAQKKRARRPSDCEKRDVSGPLRPNEAGGEFAAAGGRLRQGQGVQVGGAAFDFSATFEKGAYFEAKWTETEISVKFDDITVYVPVTDGVAKLTDVLIPAAPAAEEGKAFMGWYNGNVKATAGLEVKKGAKFVSYFASEADYAGYWTCNEAGKESMLAVVDGKLTFGEDFKRIQYTYADGQLSARIGTIRYTWLNVEKTMTGVVVSIKYYDEYDELVTDKYVLEPIKAVKGVIPAGTYKSTALL